MYPVRTNARADLRLLLFKPLGGTVLRLTQEVSPKAMGRGQPPMRCIDSAFPDIGVSAVKPREKGGGCIGESNRDHTANFGALLSGKEDLYHVKL